MLAFLNRKDVEIKAYEVQAGGALPTHLIARVLLRHARLSPAQVAKVQMWLAGSKELRDVRSALIRLDSDADLLPGMTSTSKSLWQDTMSEDWAWTESWEQESQNKDVDVYAEIPEDETSAMEANLYGEENDVGYASDLGEDWIWIHASDWQSCEPLEEQVMLEQFASFSAVHRAKAELKKSRGWPKGGFGKGKKGIKSKGLKGSSSPGWFGPTGKGLKSGSKGKGHQETRDQRRHDSGMMRVPKGDLVAKRAKCWTCGQIGHFSSACPQRSAGSGRESIQYLCVARKSHYGSTEILLHRFHFPRCEGNRWRTLNLTVQLGCFHWPTGGSSLSADRRRMRQWIDG
eukprot:1728697-Amphidinium_carterae.1